MERALLGGAVAEEAQDDLVLLAQLRGPRGAGGLGDALADDPRRAQEAALGIGQVHRAAVAAAQPVPAAVDLGHDRLRVGAEHDRVAVAAVGGHQLVVGLERRQRADDRGLGAVGQVRVAADHAGVLLERPLDALLELPDPQHLGEHPDQPVVVELGHVLAAAHRLAPGSCDAGAELRDRRLVCALELLLDRQVAQRLGQDLDSPRALVADLPAGLDVAGDVELALARAGAGG